MRHRNIWFALLTMILLRLFRTVSKYGRIGLRWMKGATLNKPGG